jgi:hypothetical protein
MRTKAANLGRLGLAASLVMLAGCGSGGGSEPPTGGAIDAGAIEAELAKRVGDVGVRQPEISCPDQAGTAFDCSVGGAGGVNGSISVTMDSADGSTYRYEGEVGNENVEGMTIELNGTVR